MRQEERRALSVFTVFAVAVLAYLIAPQFVAGLIWDAVNTAVTFWAVS
jgi:uncharacterized membrane protein